MNNPINGRRYAVAIDEEHDHKPGRLHGFLWVMDVTDLANMVPVAAWDLSERACPWVGEPGVRFGAHQYREKLDSTLVYATWFAGGLRVLDLADPLLPVEVAHFMPEPGPGRPAAIQRRGCGRQRPDLPARPQPRLRYSGDDPVTDDTSDLLPPSVDPNTAALGIRRVSARNEASTRSVMMVRDHILVTDEKGTNTGPTPLEMTLSSLLGCEGVIINRCAEAMQFCLHRRRHARPMARWTSAARAGCRVCGLISTG